MIFLVCCILCNVHVLKQAPFYISCNNSIKVLKHFVACPNLTCQQLNLYNVCLEALVFVLVSTWLQWLNEYFVHSQCRPHKITCLVLYRYFQITWYLSSLTLHTAVVGTVRSLRGSRQHSKAILYLFQKHLLCWEYEYVVFLHRSAQLPCFLCFELLC
jgi:hypothetical protein